MDEKVEIQVAQIFSPARNFYILLQQIHFYWKISQREYDFFAIAILFSANSKKYATNNAPFCNPYFVHYT